MPGKKREAEAGEVRKRKELKQTMRVVDSGSVNEGSASGTRKVVEKDREPDRGAESVRGGVSEPVVDLGTVGEVPMVPERAQREGLADAGVSDADWRCSQYD